MPDKLDAYIEPGNERLMRRPLPVQGQLLRDLGVLLLDRRAGLRIAAVLPAVLRVVAKDTGHEEHFLVRMQLREDVVAQKALHNVHLDGPVGVVYVH